MSHELWENIHASRSWGKYPDTEIVSLLMSNFASIDKRSKTKVLDLGCGSGANSMMMITESFLTYGVDFSPSAIDRLREKLETLNEGRLGQNFFVANFSDLPWPDGYFDVVVDCMAIYANDFSTIEKTFLEVERVLKKGGRFISKSWSHETMKISVGLKVEQGTLDCLTEGPCKGFGVSHFFNEQELKKLCVNFELDLLKKTIKEDILKGVSYGEWTVSGTLR